MAGQFNGQVVKQAGQKEAILFIQSDKASYMLPVNQIKVDDLLNQFGETADVQAIMYEVEIAAPTVELEQLAEQAAADGEFTIIVPPIDFTVKATYKGKTIEVTSFEAYVEITIAVPDGVGPSIITTGVVIEANGDVRHVPTKIVVKGGKYYAKVNSLTNSHYALVWHPIEFADMSGHWAREAVNDLGSRMIIKNFSDGSFNPNQSITRAEFTDVIVKGLGLKQGDGSTPFPDVNSSDLFSGSINTAYVYGLHNGFEDGKFHPSDKITREQAIEIIAKAMTITGLKSKVASASPSAPAEQTLAPFIDAGLISSWAKSSVVDSLQAGIVVGMTGTELSPKTYISRAEAATMVKRLLTKSGLI